MKVRDLKKMLAEGCESLTEEEFDGLDVLMPLGDLVDGFWQHLCQEETGVAELGIDEGDGTSVEIAFCIAPHYFIEEDDEFYPELN